MGVEMVKEYLVEISTRLPIVVSNDEVEASNSVFQLIVDKTQEIMNDYDLNESTYKVKLIAEQGVEGVKENA